MKLNGRYIIEDDKNDTRWEISSYADLYNKLDLDIFADLSQKGKDILSQDLSDTSSRNYIESYLRNKQVFEFCSTINIKGIVDMLTSCKQVDISAKTGITPTSLSKLARGIKKMNPDKGEVQVTELRNVRFSTILSLLYYYNEYYINDYRKNEESSKEVKRIVVGNLYHCQNCDFNVTGSKFCPNCGVEIEYNEK